MHLVNPTLAEQFFTMLGVIEETFHFRRACFSLGRGTSTSVGHYVVSRVLSYNNLQFSSCNGKWIVGIKYSGKMLGVSAGDGPCDPSLPGRFSRDEATGTIQ